MLEVFHKLKIKLAAVLQMYRSFHSCWKCNVPDHSFFVDYFCGTVAHSVANQTIGCAFIHWKCNLQEIAHILRKKVQELLQFSKIKKAYTLKILEN